MEAARRREDVKLTPNKVLTWLSIAGIAWAVATVAIHVQDTVEDMPAIKKRVARVERRMDIVEWYLPAIGARLGIPPPPKARHDQIADAGE